MKAINDRVVVRKAEMPDKTKGGLFIPDSVKGDGKLRMNVGEVLSFGAGTRTVNGEWLPGYAGKVGDWVAWEQFGEFQADVLGKNQWVLRAEDIMGILEPHEIEMFKQVKDPDKPEVRDIISTGEGATLTGQCGNKACKGYRKPFTFKHHSVIFPSDKECERCGKYIERPPEACGVVTNLTPKFHE